MSITIQTTQIAHLGGITANYAFANGTNDPNKPTCVLITAMSMNIQLFNDQFNDPKLTNVMNLLAIEPLGHGGTICASEHFTYWDSAQTALQVIDKLGIEKVFALGVSQGGWIVTRMALLAPEKVYVPTTFYTK
jgi:pimeloyl-ACP methyl ester carboxylesterase